MDRFNSLISFLEKYSFGVCTYIGDKMGVQASRVRVYFIYLSFVTLGSTLIPYLFVGFWINIKRYVRESASVINS
jgi:phage shock protein PspC (stress-responsive transcriptional regulator)